jgi:hypothetical protein
MGRKGTFRTLRESSHVAAPDETDHEALEIFIRVTRLCPLRGRAGPISETSAPNSMTDLGSFAELV